MYCCTGPYLRLILLRLRWRGQARQAGRQAYLLRMSCNVCGRLATTVPTQKKKPLLNPTCTHLHPSRAYLRLRCCRNYPSSLNGRSQPREAHTQAQHRGCTHSAHSPPQHGTARSMGPVRGGRCCCRTLRVRVARWRSRHPLPGVPLHRPLAVCCCCARCRRCCPSMPAEVCIIERIEV